MPTGPIEAAWIWVALAAAAPVLAHLLRPRPAPPTVFPGLMLLESGIPARSRRHAERAARLRRVARLLLRSIAMACLAAMLVGLAGDPARAGGSGRADAARPLAIVLDATASTSRVWREAGTAAPFFDVLRSEAERRIAECERDGRPFALVIAGTSDAFETDPARARGALARASPGGEADLGEAARRAIAAAGVQGGSPELHVLTDHQRTQAEALRDLWSGLDVDAVRWTPDAAPAWRDALTLSPLELMPGEASPHGALTLRVHVLNAGADEEQADVRWHAESPGTHGWSGRETRRVASGQAAEVRLTLSDLPDLDESIARAPIRVRVWLGSGVTPGPSEFAKLSEGELWLPRARRVRIDPALSAPALAAFEAAALDAGHRLDEPGSDELPALIIRATRSPADNESHAPGAATILVLDAPPPARVSRALDLPPIVPIDAHSRTTPIVDRGPLMLGITDADFSLGVARTRSSINAASPLHVNARGETLVERVRRETEDAPTVLLIHADLNAPAPSPWLPVWAAECIRHAIEPPTPELIPLGLGARERDGRSAEPVAHAPAINTQSMRPDTRLTASDRRERRQAGVLLAVLTLATLASDLALAKRERRRDA